MIKLDIIDPTADHFVLRVDEPARIEVLMLRTGAIVAHVYRGFETDQDQEALGMYDGLTRSQMGSWQDGALVAHPNPSKGLDVQMDAYSYQVWFASLALNVQAGSNVILTADVYPRGGWVKGAQCVVTDASDQMMYPFLELRDGPHKGSRRGVRRDQFRKVD